KKTIEGRLFLFVYSIGYILPYTNCPIEGINNKIKVIKRIAFGYRSFYHFKSRILITQNLTKPKLKILAA
ncbi:MAG: transposase, partial [Turicibacter sp.]|nr:transposase [Turicibacter sp.]